MSGIVKTYSQAVTAVGADSKFLAHMWKYRLMWLVVPLPCGPLYPV